MKRVMLLIDNLGSGGAQRQIALLALGLKRLGLDVFLVLYSPENHMKYMIAEEKIKIVYMEKSFFGLINGLFRIRLRYKPGSIISFLDRPNQIGFFAKFITGAKVWIPSERNLSQEREGVLWRKLMYWAAKKVVCNTHAQKCWIDRNIPSLGEKTSVIWNGSDLSLLGRTAQQVEKRDFVILGRLGAQKNPWFLIEFLRRKDKRFSDVKFVWFGEEDTESIGLREVLNGLAIKEDLNISFFPPLAEVADVVSSSKCLVLVSKYEGLPNVVLEAMFLRTLVLAPSISDLEILLGGDRGLIFKTGCLNSFSNKIEEIINMPDSDYFEYTSKAYSYASIKCSVGNMVNAYYAAVSKS